MNINQAFPSKFLKASDIDGDTQFKIASVEIEDIGMPGKKEQKPVIYFEGENKGFVCNKTNAKLISSLFGPDTDQWIGQTITLFVAVVEFQGQQTEALRVKVVPARPKRPTPVSAQKKAIPAIEQEAETEGEVPF